MSDAQPKSQPSGKEPPSTSVSPPKEVPEESSLVADSEQPKVAPVENAPIDKETQELIDEMLAEE
jgi:hypothetical protein